MVFARDAPDPIVQWIALLDEAEHRLALVRPVPGAMAVVSAAIEALHAHEHTNTMTDDERQAARERLWQRDHTDLLPPSLARMTWGVCQCRSCTLAQLTDQRRTVWQAQVQAMHTRKGR